MADKKNKSLSDDPWLVFSTLSSATSSSAEYEETSETIPPTKQKLRLQIEKNHRGGKTVVVIKGFQGPDAALQDLAKMIKQHCGVGGSTKDGEIIIQGDQKEKIIKKLLASGYKDVK